MLSGSEELNLEGLTLVVVVQSPRYVGLFKTLWLKHTKFPCPSPSPGVCPSLCSLNRWCHPTISPSHSPPTFNSFDSYNSNIFPSIRVFSNESALLIRWPTIGASASASVLPMNIQGRFPLGLTVLISLLFKGLSWIPFMDQCLVVAKGLA